MKKYEIIINFKEWKNKMSMETIVNGAKMPLPPRLKIWIAEDCLNEMLARARNEQKKGR